MKKKSFLIVLMVIPMFFQWLNSIKEDETSKGARETHEVLEQTAKMLESKYGLHVMGIGESGDKEKIDGLDIFFKIDRPLTKSEARKIIVDSFQIFLTSINTNKKLEPFLANKPFTYDDFQITIFITDKSQKLYYPNISVVSTFKDTITFKTNDPLDENKYRSKTKETFEEALEKLELSRD